jgi:hypothetical protein
MGSSSLASQWHLEILAVESGIAQLGSFHASLSFRLTLPLRTKLAAIAGTNRAGFANPSCLASGRGSSLKSPNCVPPQPHFPLLRAKARPRPLRRRADETIAFEHFRQELRHRQYRDGPARAYSPFDQHGTAVQA